jgi:hypothetical protein
MGGSGGAGEALKSLPDPWCHVRVSLDLGDDGEMYVWAWPVGGSDSICGVLDEIKVRITDSFARDYARRVMEREDA